MNFDERFSRFLFERTKDSYVLTKFAIFCGSFLIWIMLGMVIGSVGEMMRNELLEVRQYLWALLFILSILFPWSITFVLSRWVKRPRPFESEHYKPIIKLFVYTNSFPSAHSTIAFALAGAFIYPYDPVMLSIMLVCAVLVGLGRMMVGVHYVSDVVVGALIGFFGGLAFRFGIMLLILSLFGN